MHYKHDGVQGVVLATTGSDRDWHKDKHRKSSVMVGMGRRCLRMVWSDTTGVCRHCSDFSSGTWNAPPSSLLDKGFNILHMAWADGTPELNASSLNTLNPFIMLTARDEEHLYRHGKRTWAQLYIQL